jgi:hypothetical protein
MEFSEQNITDWAKHYQIPENMHEGIVRWILKGIRPGHFLRSVIDNDLKGAILNADDVNIFRLTAYVHFFYNAAPVGCWGSKEKADKWHNEGGLRKEKSAPKISLSEIIEDGEFDE